MDLALNNQQRLICHKTQATNQPDCWKGFPSLETTSIDKSMLFKNVFPLSHPAAQSNTRKKLNYVLAVNDKHEFLKFYLNKI